MSRYNLTTTPVTLDCVAAVCIFSAIEDQIKALEKKLDRVKRESARTKISNHIKNLRRAQGQFAPAYDACIKAPMFTPEYQALIDAAK